MKDLTKIDLFISILHDVLERKANIIGNDVKIKLKIRDRLWSAIFLLEYNELGIGVNKNGVTYSFPEFNCENEVPVCTIKEFLEYEIMENKITLLELEKLLFNSL
jgi:hypothetical protein